MVQGRVRRHAVEELEDGAILVQAGLRGRAVRGAARSTRVEMVQGSMHGEHTVQHTWLASGTLGLRIVPRGIDADVPKGVIVSEVPDSATATLYGVGCRHMLCPKQEGPILMYCAPAISSRQPSS